MNFGDGVGASFVLGEDHSRAHSIQIGYSAHMWYVGMGMAQVLAAVAYGIKGVRRGETTWQWPDFSPDLGRENRAQMARWSINTAPDWHFPPLAIAHQYWVEKLTNPKNSDIGWCLLNARDMNGLRETEEMKYTQQSHRNIHRCPCRLCPWAFMKPFSLAADATPLPTYICLPSGLYRSRTGRMVERESRYQEIISLPGIFFFDGWRVQPSLKIPANVPLTQDVPDRGTPRAKAAEEKKETRQPEEEARDILAAA